MRTFSLTAAGLLILSGVVALSGSAQVVRPEGACRSIDLQDAIGLGDATALRVVEGNTGLKIERSVITVSQDGPGVEEKNANALRENIEEIVRVETLSSLGLVNVTYPPLRTDLFTRALALRVDILEGLITADEIVANGTAIATWRHGFTHARESTFTNLRIDGVLYEDVAPNTIVELPADVAGEGSYVILYERQDRGIFPTSASPFFQTEITVRMIHAFIMDSNPVLPGDQKVEIVVAESHSFAQAPTPWCGIRQNVNASGYVARVRPPTQQWTEGILVGYKAIPPTGGSAKQQLTDLHINSVRTTLNATETRATGYINVEEKSRARTVVKAANLCVIDRGQEGCRIFAEAIRSEANAEARPDQRFSWGDVTIVNLTVEGINVCQRLAINSTCEPEKNTKLEIAGFKIYLNRQFKDFGEPGHAGRTVYAIWIEHPEFGTIILGRAKAGATYGFGAPGA